VRDRRAVTDAASAVDPTAPADLVNPPHPGAQVPIAPPAVSDPEWVSRFVPNTQPESCSRRLKPALYNAVMIASCNAGLTVVIALLSGVGCTRLVSSAT